MLHIIKHMTGSSVEQKDQNISTKLIQHHEFPFVFCLKISRADIYSANSFPLVSFLNNVKRLKRNKQWKSNLPTTAGLNWQRLYKQ